MTATCVPARVLAIMCQPVVRHTSVIFWPTAVNTCTADSVPNGVAMVSVPSGVEAATVHSISLICPSMVPSAKLNATVPVTEASEYGRAVETEKAPEVLVSLALMPVAATITSLILFARSEKKDAVVSLYPPTATTVVCALPS